MGILFTEVITLVILSHIGGRYFHFKTRFKIQAGGFALLSATALSLTDAFGTNMFQRLQEQLAVSGMQTAWYWFHCGLAIYAMWMCLYFIRMDGYWEVKQLEKEIEDAENNG